MFLLDLKQHVFNQATSNATLLYILPLLMTKQEKHIISSHMQNITAPVNVCQQMSKSYIKRCFAADCLSAVAWQQLMRVCFL